MTKLDEKGIEAAALLTVCRVLKPNIFGRGIDPLPGDGPGTRRTIEDTKALATKLITAYEANRSPEGVTEEEVAAALRARSTKFPHCVDVILGESGVIYPSQRDAVMRSALEAAAKVRQQGEHRSTSMGQAVDAELRARHILADYYRRECADAGMADGVLSEHWKAHTSPGELSLLSAIARGIETPSNTFEEGRVKGLREAAKEIEDHFTGWTSPFGKDEFGIYEAGEQRARAIQKAIQALIPGGGE